MTVPTVRGRGSDTEVKMRVCARQAQMPSWLIFYQELKKQNKMKNRRLDRKNVTVRPLHMGVGVGAVLTH